MRKWWVIGAVVALAAVAGVSALVWSGAWPGPSDVERAQARAYFFEAEQYAATGHQDAALASLDNSVRLDPQNDALRLRATLLVARADYDGALRDLDKVISRGGGLSANYSLRCWLRVRRGALEGARKDCDRALEIDPALASAFGNRGLVGLRQGRHRDAWNDFNTAMRIGGSDEWVAWRLFGRGVAAWGQGDVVAGRQDIQLALNGNPGVAAEFAQFGLGAEVVRELDDASYAAAINPRSLLSLQQYLYIYPDGAHASEARVQIAEIYALIAEEEAAGRLMLPGFSFEQARGSGPSSDSFGAIATSRSTWRVAFATDYATGVEAERAAAAVCNTASVRDCDAYAFRNVCAALAASPRERAQGLAWAHGQDDAVRTALASCRARGGGTCVPIHSQCTPTLPVEAATPAASP